MESYNGVATQWWKICAETFVLTESTNVTDGRTDRRIDTAWWYRPRLCIAKIVRFWWNLVYTDADLELHESYVTKHDLLKLKMTDGSHNLKIVFAVTQQLIAQFQWIFVWGSSFSQNFSNVTYRHSMHILFSWCSLNFCVVSDTFVINKFSP